MFSRPCLLTVILAAAVPGLAQQPDERPAYQVPKRTSFADVPPPHSSIVRIKPWHEDFVPRNQYAFRNPGGVGRRAEYYPPGDDFQLQVPRAAPHITAKIGLGGQPDRNEQLRSQSVGTAYYSALQQHIDNYGRPMMGFGMGFGW